MKPFQAAAATHKGHRRSDNQDHYFIDPNLEYFAVADGIGGLPAGAKASAAAINSLRRQISVFPPPEMGELFQNCHHAVRDIARRHSPILGCGTTLTVLRQSKPYWEIGHIGDSLAFCLSKEPPSLRTLTSSHQVAVEGDPYRHRLHRYLGQPERMFCEYRRFLGCGDETLLLATDGIGELSKLEKLRPYLQRELPPQALANLLLRESLRLGGHDNVTILVCGK
ncbi:MAG: protein phosphatase 2C domain-containing protein [Opitutales bacterium]|nr:protein phosphatase 2C domain-containing protein [Opitutales bacterium]MCH8539423.1 protein phosphatase 2C domain-containing protein [Opitutales bacterium]